MSHKEKKTAHADSTKKPLTSKSTTKSTARSSETASVATKRGSPPKSGSRNQFDTAPSKPIDQQENPKPAVVLLSGGNPQIAKADGDEPVQAYIAAMPGWKSALGKRLDAIIVSNVPHVRKAVRWNSPFYGIEGQGWFVSFHVLTRYVKVTFFEGLSLHPIPPGGTDRSKDARWIDIYEDDQFDEAQMAGWIKQAAALPGWVP